MCKASSSLFSNFSWHFVQVSLCSAYLWVLSLGILVKLLPQSSHIWVSTGLDGAALLVTGPGGPGIILFAPDEGPGGPGGQGVQENYKVHNEII